MRKIRVVIINHALASGGTDSFVINIVNAIDKNKFDITVVLALDKDNIPQFRENEVLETGVNILRTSDLDGIKKKCIHLLRLYRIFIDNGPFDTVHSNMDLFNGLNLLIARFAGIKNRISHSHNSSSQYATTFTKRMVVNVYRFIMRQFINNNATLKLGCSSLANEYLYGKENCQSKNTIVLYNGIPLKEYLVENKRNEEVLSLNLITVGRFNNQKNPEFIVQVIRELSKLRNDFKFQWIGTGTLKPMIEAQVNDFHLENVIEFMGVRKDIPYLLKNSDLFLMPSLFEGLPISLIEAQAANIDCFISDTITHEIDCGKCHFISLDKDASYWAAQINIFLNKRDDKGLDFPMLYRFDIENMIIKISEFYAR